MALKVGKPGHGGRGGKRLASSGLGVVLVSSHHRAEPEEKGAPTQGLVSACLGVDDGECELPKKDPGVRPHLLPLGGEAKCATKGLGNNKEDVELIQSQGSLPTPTHFLCQTPSEL